MFQPEAGNTVVYVVMLLLLRSLSVAPPLYACIHLAGLVVWLAKQSFVIDHKPTTNYVAWRRRERRFRRRTLVLESVCNLPFGMMMAIIEIRIKAFFPSSKCTLRESDQNRPAS